MKLNEYLEHRLNGLDQREVDIALELIKRYEDKEVLREINEQGELETSLLFPNFMHVIEAIDTLKQMRGVSSYITVGMVIDYHLMYLDQTEPGLLLQKKLAAYNTDSRFNTEALSYAKTILCK